MNKWKTFARTYDRSQLHAIAESRQKALESIIRDACIRTTGLSFDDPPELWRFAIGHFELMLDWEPYKQFRAALGNPTLRETILSLAERFKDEAGLTKHLETLLKLFKRLPLTKSNYEINRRDYDKKACALIEFWIDEPLHHHALKRNFCFFSDRAMAKMVYFLANKKEKWLPAESLDKEPERIRKLYGSLGLIPAKPRVIKDVDFIAGKIHYTPFQNALTEGT